jgi:transposase
MDTDPLLHERQRAIHLLRAGRHVSEVARALGRSERWVRKWRKRYDEEKWAGLKSRSRRPKRLACRLPEAVRQAIRETRSELEAQATTGEGLKYIGSSAIRTRLKEKGVSPLPSCRTIERVLREAGMTRPRCPTPPTSPLPHLQAIGPHTLIQMDIVPHFLRGGQPVACFNALEVGTRYPAGRAYSHRRTQEAMDFLVYVLQTIGIPTYIQVDNEGCFSGETTHPYVLGRLIRLALMVGTELVFSAIREPKSQAFIERFHQDYDRHVWQDTDLASVEAVNGRGDGFFQAYRRRPHPQMGGRTPQEAHQAVAVRRLPSDFQIPSGRIPLYAGRVHFIRRVGKEKTIRVLNVSWPVPKAEVGQGVWATLELQPGQKAWLRIYDGAPDAPRRNLLAVHPFPVREPIYPRPERQKESAGSSLPRVRVGWAEHLGVMADRALARIGTMSWRFLCC